MKTMSNSAKGNGVTPGNAYLLKNPPTDAWGGGVVNMILSVLAVTCYHTTIYMGNIE